MPPMKDLLYCGCVVSLIFLILNVVIRTDQPSSGQAEQEYGGESNCNCAPTSSQHSTELHVPREETGDLPTILSSRAQAFVDTVRDSGSWTDKVTGITNKKIHNPHQYQFAYGFLLHYLRDRKVKMLEIGLGCDTNWGPGASLPLWKAWFGSELELEVLEFDAKCATDFAPQVGRMWIGDQSDRTLLRSIVDAAKRTTLYDVIIDDGGHKMHQQINSWQELWSALKPGGIYVIEDMHSSFQTRHDGGYGKAGTTLEYVKKSLDAFYPEHLPEDAFPPEAKHAFEIHATFCWAQLCAFIKKW